MYKMVYKNGEPVFNNRSGNQVVGSYDYCMDVFYKQKLVGVRIRFSD